MSKKVGRILGIGLKRYMNSLNGNETQIPVSRGKCYFREWMSTQTSSAGTICTPSMISANSSALKRVCGMMDIVEYPDVNNLFSITDIDTFLDIKAIIRSHADFDDVNKACGNGFLKSALNWYEKYLNYILSSRQEAAVQVDEHDKDKFLDEVFMTSEG